MKRYFRNLWHALIGSPAYVPSRHNVERIVIEADTSDACKAIDDLRVKTEHLAEALNKARSMAEELEEFAGKPYLK